MKKPPDVELTRAIGFLKATISTEPKEFVATHVYATLWGNVLNLTDSYESDIKNGESIDINYRDRILGNGQADLPPPGTYAFPHPDITVKYYGRKNGVFFNAHPVDGSITIEQQVTFGPYKGTFNINFSLNSRPVNIVCHYDLRQ